MDNVLVVRGLEKTYVARDNAYGTLRDRLSSWRTPARAPRPAAAGSHVALSGVDLDVAPGELVALIGANGAGKSTLLRAVARIVFPDAGTIAVRGRMAGLIELGAGFHPELTARENIVLHGALLGLEPAEVRGGMEALLDFAGLADRADVPIKRFSTGMYARLGFSAAVHAQPNLLVVDEILAVGDAAFQVRSHERLACLRRAGTGVLWVSHDLEAVRRHADRVVWLERGTVRTNGAPGPTLAAYADVCCPPGG